MDRDRYILQISASSVLNMSPAARRDKVEGWFATGRITLAQANSMSGEPDLEKLSELGSSTYDAVAYQIQAMLRGEAQVPDPQMNLGLGLQLVVDEYNRILPLNPGEQILGTLRNWMLLAESMLNAQPPAPAPAPAMPGMGPMPGPGMAPGPVVDPMMAGPVPPVGMPGVM